MNFFSKADLTGDVAALLEKAFAKDEIIGMRPEHLSPAAKGKAVLEGKLELVENLGEYALAHLTTETGVEFIAKVEKPPAIALGDMMQFSIRPDLVHVFDVATGLRV